MNKDLSISLRVSFFTILLTGIFYPYLIAEISNLIFHHKAKGSLLYDENKRAVGSELIGQLFQSKSYFHSRPSTAGSGYDGLASGASNDSPTSKKFISNVQERTQKLKTNNEERIPIDLVTASASGLDPHITPEAARWQAPQIALARDISLRRVLSIVSDNTQHPHFGLLGGARVNVLKLNVALDQFFGQPVGLK